MYFQDCYFKCNFFYASLIDFDNSWIIQILMVYNKVEHNSVHMQLPTVLISSIKTFVNENTFVNQNINRNATKRLIEQTTKFSKHKMRMKLETIFFISELLVK